MNLPSRIFVIIAHVKSYADPIAAKKGDVVTLSGKTDIWDGHRWLWAAAPDGREGWVPDGLIEAASPQKANRDYSAEELPVFAASDCRSSNRGTAGYRCAICLGTGRDSGLNVRLLPLFGHRCDHLLVPALAFFIAAPRFLAVSDTALAGYRF